MMSPAPDPGPPGPLFRSEAVAEGGTPWLGRVLLAPSLAHGLMVGFVAAILAGLLAVLALGEYTRSVRMTGWLVPGGGEGASAPLEARFVVTGEEVGSLRPGQAVRLHYGTDPDPELREGLLQSLAPILPEPEEVLGSGAEPGFLVTVALPAGVGAALLPGLAVEAEVPVETRRLYQWVLGPLRRGDG